MAVQQRNQKILYTVGKAALFTASEPYELKNTQPAQLIYLENSPGKSSRSVSPVTRRR